MFRLARTLGKAVLEKAAARVLGGAAQASAPVPVVAPKPRTLPPVFLFVDGARGREDAAAIEALCTEHGTPAQRRDIGDDEAMREFVLREARIDRDDLPVVFVANRVLGGLVALRQRASAGELATELRTA